MRKFYTKLILFVLTISPVFMQAQNGYDITLQIKGIDDTVCYMAYYKADLTLLHDTAYNYVGDGKFNFKADTLITEGMYIFAGQKSNKYFDFLIDEDQQFEIVSDTAALLSNIKVKGSKTNSIFFDYANFLNSKQKMAKPFNEKLRKYNGTDSATFYRNKLITINEDVTKFRKNFLIDNKDNFAGIFLLGTIDLDRPEIPVDENGIQDSTFLYKYYKAHYWDNIPLSDNRMLYTPYFENKLEQYIEKVIPQHPDSLINAIDDLLSRSKNAKDIFQHIMWKMTIKYETSPIMGFDAVFVHIATKYYKAGLTDWMYSQVVTNIIERSDEIEPLLLGKIGPNLVLLDTTDQVNAIHMIDKKYTIVYFWSTDCGHCKRENPKLKEFYAEYKDKLDFEIFGVNTDTSFVAWKAYINEHELPWTNVSGYKAMIGNYHKLYDIYTTPTIYILDKEKKIIGKKILTDQIKGLLFQLEGIEE